jgi:hypothetical protein
VWLASLLHGGTQEKEGHRVDTTFQELLVLMAFVQNMGNPSSVKVCKGYALAWLLVASKGLQSGGAIAKNASHCWNAALVKGIAQAPKKWLTYIRGPLTARHTALLPQHIHVPGSFRENVRPRP